MKKLPTLLAGAVLALSFTGAAHAQQRPDHFKGLPADTLEVAVANFSEHNRQLATILEKDQLAATDLVKVHELTYTLENALAKINAELGTLAETLEEVHVASERMNAEGVKTQGQKYLGTARAVIR